uniref:Uncharacterized protein n=1 Tax=Triticum urartu TaxID=4572 RepID=A0A8R7UYG0_TRIUA
VALLLPAEHATPNRVERERDSHGDLELRLTARSSVLVVTRPRSPSCCPASSASLLFLPAGSAASLGPAPIRPHFRRWRFCSSDSVPPPPPPPLSFCCSCDLLGRELVLSVRFDDCIHPPQLFSV